MKLPKETKRYCPSCKKHTAQKISVVSQKARSASHPMSRWSRSRMMARGLRRGYGNKGKASKPGVKNWKRKVKVTRRMKVLYTCKVCGKGKTIKKAMRAGRIEVGEKVAK